MGLTGFVISIATTNVAARYVALFLQAGSYAGYVGNTVKSTWPVMLTRRQLHRFLLVDQFLFPRPPAKRAVAIALINAFSQVGNIAGSYVWFDEAHAYRASYGIVAAMFGATIIGAYGFRIMLSRLNKELDQQESRPETMEETDDERLRLSKGFRYLV
jgi:hypothetical protein